MRVRTADEWNAEQTARLRVSVPADNTVSAAFKFWRQHGMALKGSTFTDRRDEAAAAKRALVERFKARPPADDPAVLARAAERQAIAEAREKRAAERALVKAAQDEKRKAEEEAKMAAEAQAAAEAEARLAEQAARDEAIRAERKAARDAKYAARKARR